MEVPPEAVGIGVGIGVIALGAVLLLDDYKDFGLSGAERSPPVPHHWLYGVLIIAGGVALICWCAACWLKRLSQSKNNKGSDQLLNQVGQYGLLPRVG